MSSPAFVAVVIFHVTLAVIGFGFVYLGFRLLVSKPNEQHHELWEARNTLTKVLGSLHCGHIFTLVGLVVILLCLCANREIYSGKVGIGASNDSITPIADNSQAWATSTLLGVGNVVASVILALLTAWYAWSSHVQLKQQNTPSVVVFTRRSKAKEHVIEIVIQNVGPGIARDVRVDRSERTPRDEWEEFLNQPTSTPFTYTPIAKGTGHGIPILLPGEKLVCEWDCDCANALRSDGFYVRCRYGRSGPGPELSDEFFLERRPELDSRRESVQ